MFNRLFLFLFCFCLFVLFVCFVLTVFYLVSRNLVAEQSQLKAKTRAQGYFKRGPVRLQAVL
jgi:hypothetical protein